MSDENILSYTAALMQSIQADQIAMMPPEEAGETEDDAEDSTDGSGANIIEKCIPGMRDCKMTKSKKKGC